MPKMHKLSFCFVWFISAAITLGNIEYAQARPIHFVLDIDHVLIDNIKEEDATALDLTGRKVFHSGGYVYVLETGATEFIQSLLDVPESTVSFFSAGERTRNLELLGQWDLPRGRDKKKTVLEIADKLFSSSDLTHADATDSKTYNNINPEFGVLKSGDKKDLTRLVTREELPWTILIDDTVTNAMAGQEWNLLWVKRTNRERMIEANTPDRFYERNKLLRTAAILERVIKKVTETGSPPIEVLKQLQWKSHLGSDPTYDSSLIYEPELYNRGEAILKAVNSKFRKVGKIPAFPLVPCAIRNLQSDPKLSIIFMTPPSRGISGPLKTHPRTSNKSAA